MTNNKAKPATRQVAVDKTIMQKLKILAAENDMKIKDCVNQALTDYIDSFNGAGK